MLLRGGGPRPILRGVCVREIEREEREREAMLVGIRRGKRSSYIYNRTVEVCASWEEGERQCLPVAVER